MNLAHCNNDRDEGFEHERLVIQELEDIFDVLYTPILLMYQYLSATSLKRDQGKENEAELRRKVKKKLCGGSYIELWRNNQRIVVWRREIL